MDRQEFNNTLKKIDQLYESKNYEAALNLIK